MKNLLVLLLLAFLFVACDGTNTQSITDTIQDSFAGQSIDAPVAAPKNVYLILDGSGSGTDKYAVPKIDWKSVERLIGQISENGGGHLYLNFVDKEAANNPILNFHVPAMPIKPQLRGKFVGEQNYQYQKLQKEHAAALAKYDEALAHTKKTIADFIAANRSSWESYLTKAYSPKSSSDDYSDVIGVLNSAFRSLEASKNTERSFVLALSDLEHDQSPNAATKTLNPKPIGVKIVRVNASDSGQKITETDHEADSFDNALSHIFNAN